MPDQRQLSTQIRVKIDSGRRCRQDRSLRGFFAVEDNVFLFTGWVYFVTLKNVSPFMGETGGVVRAKRALTAPREGVKVLFPSKFPGIPFAEDLGYGRVGQSGIPNDVSDLKN